MKAVILAGGLGTRLRPFTEIIPKPLLPIGEKSVMEIQIGRLKKYGFTDIYLATNYKAEYVKNFFGDGSRYGVNIHVSEEKKPLGTAGPLTLLKKELTEPFVLMNGDILSLIDFGEFYNFAADIKSPLALAIKKYITPFAFGDILFKGDYVTRIEEKPDIVKYILAGIYVMTPEVFNYIPDDQYYGMDQLIHSLMENGTRVAKYEIQEYWLDIGQLDDFEKAQSIYNEHFKSEVNA